MPKLPVEQFSRNSEILQKGIWSAGNLSLKKIPAIPFYKKAYFRSFPVKVIFGLFIILVVTVGAYTILIKLNPNLLKKFNNQQANKTPQFLYPINVNDIKYPSEILKQKFLNNLQMASKETDKSKVYKLLEEDFSYILGFYVSTHSYDLRVQLDKYKDYMKVNYSGDYQKNLALYNYVCQDMLCPGARDTKKPDEVSYVEDALAKNKSINSVVRDSIIRNLDTAVLAKDKNAQGNNYVLALISLSIEYKNSNDPSIKDMYLKLNSYVSPNYPEFKVPDNERINP